MIKTGHPSDHLPGTAEGWDDWLALALELNLIRLNDDGTYRMTAEGGLVWLDHRLSMTTQG